MQKIRSASLIEAQNIALPILTEGFKKRRKLRSRAEEALRSPEKVARDRASSSIPHLSSI